MKNPFSLFNRNDVDLKTKWWHRLCVVFYVIILIVVAGAALIGHFDGKELVKERPFNISTTSTWADYISQASGDFSEAQKKQYNTYRASGMSPEDAKRLAETPSFSGFMSVNNDRVGCFDESGRFNTLSKYTSDDTRNKVCNGDNSIVAYDENVVYHIQGIVYVVLLVLLWAVVMQLIYYKVFLYIVFGSNKVAKNDTNTQ